MKQALFIAAEVTMVAVAFAALVVGFIFGTSKSEVAECIKWSEQANAYPAFYLAKWQDEQCRAHGIIISAPVK